MPALTSPLLRAALKELADDISTVRHWSSRGNAAYWKMVVLDDIEVYTRSGKKIDKLKKLACGE